MDARHISSTANPRLKAAVRLRSRRERDRRGLTLIDGVRETLRALQGGAVLREVFVMPDLLVEAEAGVVLDRLRAGSVPVLELGRDAFERLAYGDRLDGVIAVAEIPLRRLADFALPPEPLIAVVEGVEKPGNLGAVLRSADGAGVSALILADPVADPFNPNVIRASMGTIFTVPLAQAPATEVLTWLRQLGIRILAARVDAGRDHTRTDMRGPLAIVLGSEAEGLTAAWSGEDVSAVRIPMLGVADSLNVSATAAVLFYEALRQRGGETGTHAD